MTTIPWSFRPFAQELAMKAKALEADGFVVDFQESAPPRASVRLRAESATRIAELTVWDDGTASELVADLDSGEYVYVRDGTQLASGDMTELQVFFEQAGVRRK